MGRSEEGEELSVKKFLESASPGRAGSCLRVIVSSILLLAGWLAAGWQLTILVLEAGSQRPAPQQGCFLLLLSVVVR